MPFLLLILLMVVGAVLLMACANVANVQLARAAARRQEIAVKMALGAHRFRLVRQLLAESFLVAAFGGAIGLFLAYWVVSYLATLPVMQAPGAARLHMDRAVLAFVAALCVICTIVSGLVPAWQITKSNLLAHIKTASRSTLGEAGQTRFNNSLVIGEFALSFVLLVIAVMGTRSFLNMANTDPGFSAQGILTSHISLPVPRYAGPDRVRDFFSRLLAKTETLPGVEAAAISTGIPPHAQTNVRAVRVEGRQPESPSGQMVSYQVASPGYFRLLAATPLEGRTFTSADQQDTPRVVVINRRLAEMFFPNERPLGKRLLIPISVPGRADLADAVPYEIVGVVRDSKNPSPAEPALPEVYLSYLQAPWTSEYLVVRSRVDTAPLTAALRAVLREIDPDQPLTEVQTMQGRYRDALAGVRLSTTLLGVFAAIALLLGNIGLYGIVSYSVSQRTSEFALRMALGAKRHEVFRLVRNRALRLLLMGGAIGLPLALCVSLLVRASLYGISPVSPITFSLVALIHVMVTLTASFLPARRATKIDPMVALRYE